MTGIENGRYTIIAIEGVITDVAKQLEKKNYAMLTSSFIKISAEEKEKTVELFLSEPLEILKITSIDMQSQYCANLVMNDNSNEIFIIDTLKSPGDSIFVNLEKSNRLETYQIPEYIFILPEITDTLAPKLSQYFFNKDNSWKEEIDEFANIILKNLPIKTGNIYDALMVMKMIEKIYRADKKSL